MSARSVVATLLVPALLLVTSASGCGTSTVSIKQPGDDTPGPGLILPPELAAIKIPKHHRGCRWWA